MSRLPPDWEQFEDIVEVDWNRAEIDAAKDGDEVPAEEQNSSKALNGFVLQRIRRWKGRNLHDQGLWDQFREDFAGWRNKEQFSRLDKDVRSLLRFHLHTNGVFVVSNYTNIGTRLEALLQQNATQHKWTEDEAAEMLKGDGVFNSKFNKDFVSPNSSRFININSDTSRAGSQQRGRSARSPSRSSRLSKVAEDDERQQRAVEAGRDAIRKAKEMEATEEAARLEARKKRLEEEDQEDEERRKRRQQADDPIQTPRNPPGFPQLNYTNPRNGETSYRYVNTNEATAYYRGALKQPQFKDTQLPLREPMPTLAANKQPPNGSGRVYSENVPSEPPEEPNDNGNATENADGSERGTKKHYNNNYEESMSKQILKLINLYRNNDKIQYSGVIYDFIDSKLKVFYDYCEKCSIPDEYLHKAYSAMLTSKASTYFMDHILGVVDTFVGMVQKTKDHFENDEHKLLYHREWLALKFRTFIDNNPTLTRVQQLELLIERLMLLQQGLSYEYQTDVVLRDRLIVCVEGIEECSQASFRPTDSFEGLCNDLRSSIGAHMRVKATSQFNTNTPPSQPSPQYPQHIGQSEELLEYAAYIMDRGYRRGGFGGNQGQGGGGRFQSGQGSYGTTYRGTGGTGPNRDSGGGTKGGFRGGGTGNPIRRKPTGPSPHLRCSICGLYNHWSTMHTLEERNKAFHKFVSDCEMLGMESSPEAFMSLNLRMEGSEHSRLSTPSTPGSTTSSTLDAHQQMMMDMAIESEWDGED